MQKLSIFDDGNFIARISFMDGISFLFARTSRQWSDMKRLLDSVEKLYEADSTVDVVSSLVKMLHSFNYSTELINE
jgi:hypothetical protein